ncbi:hypothetical protein, partial [Candidatus Binatus sp.]|uniref:hypothetical protein n=1 Tax=Candidatus Binatus sp. TaxID=2811406 RepID=UPI003C65565E
MDPAVQALPRRRDAQEGSAALDKKNHFIECETRDGFHVSFGIDTVAGGDACTQGKKSRNGEDTISV